jgi:hypothetical protein
MAAERERGIGRETGLALTKVTVVPGPPSIENVTLPVGVPVAPPAADTVAVNVTG